MERVKGFEPSTFCLGSRHSAAELHPLKEILGKGPLNVNQSELPLPKATPYNLISSSILKKGQPF